MKKILLGLLAVVMLATPALARPAAPSMSLAGPTRDVRLGGEITWVESWVNLPANEWALTLVVCFQDKDLSGTLDTSSVLSPDQVYAELIGNGDGFRKTGSETITHTLGGGSSEWRTYRGGPAECWAQPLSYGRGDIKDYGSARVYFHADGA